MSSVRVLSSRRASPAAGLAPGLGAVLALVACTHPSAAPPASGPDACAADAPWLVAILGEVPDKSNSIHLDHAAQDPALAAAIAAGHGREMDGDSLMLRNVSWSSQETYEYDQGRQSNQRTQVVVVARQVTGKDPRTLGTFGEPPAFAAPLTLRSGVLEYPSNHPASPTDREGGKVLFAFADGTWVIVEGWMEPRFRAVFEGSAQSPPLPGGPSDVYVEYCMPKERPGPHDDGSKTGGVEMHARHQAMRFRVGQLPGYELVEIFDTPAQATAAAEAQKTRCQTRTCGVVAATVDGRVVRYLVR